MDLMCHKRSTLFVGCVLCLGLIWCVELTLPLHHQDEIFQLGDRNNDSRLSMKECEDVWMTFDVDKDGLVSRIEFVFRWTFANLDDSIHTPLFFRLIDHDFDGYLQRTEIQKLCNFFDDDEDTFVSVQEFNLNWDGMFNVQRP